MMAKHTSPRARRQTFKRPVDLRVRRPDITLKTCGLYPPEPQRTQGTNWSPGRAPPKCRSESRLLPQILPKTYASISPHDDAEPAPRGPPDLALQRFSLPPCRRKPFQKMAEQP